MTDSTVTDADREEAHRLLLMADGSCFASRVEAIAGAIARARAEEREAAGSAGYGHIHVLRAGRGRANSYIIANLDECK